MRLTLILLLLASSLLVGCGGHVYKSSGKPVEAPGGYTQLCKDVPGFPSCLP